ncbi:MAG: asparagine synthase (glutamine-hydrolyzing) [Acidobacteriota bacterium]
MCGIAAYLGDNIMQGEGFISRANSLLTHRGPDDEGVFKGNRVVLGHRRLSIVDLSAAAHQPVLSPNGRWALIYNGEMYNHLDLRHRLCKGWDFRSHSDGETVLAALALNGPAVFEQMVGMWALALWDAHEQRLLLSRDRYGQKPLYWRLCADGSLRFASEIQPLLEEGERPAMYAPAVAEYLATGNYGHLGERTFFRDIYSFPPAHWTVVTAGNQTLEPHRYWRFPIPSKRDRRPYDETARQRFRSAFEEAVSSQLMSDVPVGATLSGGLDSSAVVGAMASRQTGGPIPVFTAQADGSDFDESRYVKAVADRWRGRLDIHWVRLEKMTISELLQQTIRTQEEPFGDPSIIAHGLLMDAARKAGVPVILGGQGGDELLFGYGYMGYALLAASLREGKVGWAFTEARSLNLGGKSLARIGLSALFPKIERNFRHRSRMKRRTWLLSALREAIPSEHLQLASTSNLTSVWLETIERVALPHLTHYDDRSGMARSIEGRMPFLDHRLADVVGSLDETAFLKGGRLKRILRDACSDLIPESVLNRHDKIGFFTPLRDMLKAEREWVRRMVTDEYARALNLFDVDILRSHVDAIAGVDGKGDGALRIWRALAVRVWAETFQVRSLADS